MLFFEVIVRRADGKQVVCVVLCHKIHDSLFFFYVLTDLIDVFSTSRVFCWRFPANDFPV